MKLSTDFDNMLLGLNQANNINPFVGLRSYEPHEGHLFFGRDDQIKDLLVKLYDTHFLAVVGRSGCGKSSLIKAGLIPKLKGGFLTGSRDYWLSATMRPSGNPLKAFVDSMNDAFVSDDDGSDKPNIFLTVDDLLELGCSGFIEKIKGVLQNRRFNLLILVDQFEELFTYKLSNETQKNENIFFVNLLVKLANEPGLPVFTIITMRSDYIGHCNMFYDLPELMNNAQYLVPKLKWQQVREVIEFPIKLCGKEINPGLLDMLTNDSDKELDQLPVLQHCLMRTYQVWKNDDRVGAIGFQHYEKTGGLNQSIKIHADEVYDSLTATQKQVAKCLFQSITEITPYNESIRKPQKFKDILNICTGVDGATREDLIVVINKFRDNDCAFLTISEKSINILDDAVIDISHESLLRQWDLLSGWMLEEEVLVKKLKRLSENVKNKNELLTGTDLKDAIEWRKNINNNHFWAKQYDENFEEIIKYLDKSINERNKIKKTYYGIGLGILILIIALSYFGIKLFIGEQVKKEEKVQKQKAKDRQNSVRIASDSLLIKMEKFNAIGINDTPLIKASLKSILTNYAQTDKFYKEIIADKHLDLDNTEKVSLLVELQGVNYQLKDALEGKLNLNESWGYNAYLYTEIVNRFQSNVILAKQKYDLMHSKLNQVDYSTRYGALSFRQLFAKDFKGSISSAQKGLKIYQLNDWIYTDLAAAYLLDRQYDKALKIYSQYAKKVYTNREDSFKSAFMVDLIHLENKKVIDTTNVILMQKIKEIKTLLIRS